MQDKPTNQNIISFQNFNITDPSTWIPTARNYCGPNWSAGQRIIGKVDEQKFKEVPPVLGSQLDKACYNHDLLYNEAIGKPNEKQLQLEADIKLLENVYNEFPEMDDIDKSYSTFLVPTFILKLAAIDTSTSIFEAIKNKALPLISNIFSNTEFKKAFQLSNPFTDGSGNIMSGGFDDNGNIVMHFGKTITDVSGASNDKILNATFLGKDVSSMFNTDLKFSPKSSFSLTETDLAGNQTTSRLSLYQGDKSLELANSGIIPSYSLSGLEEAIIRIKDTEEKEFSLVKDVWIPLKDGTIATVESVIEAIDYSIEATANFLTYEAQKTADIIIERIKSDSYLDSLIGSVLADVILGENDPKQIAKTIAI